MIILRIDDVGRMDFDQPDEFSDPSLKYFADWRSKAGLPGLPVVYGVTFSKINNVGLDLLNSFDSPEIVAIHGITHEMGEPICSADLINARSRLKWTTSYIPPFNSYDHNLISKWSECGGEYLLGGFHEEHHTFGEEPAAILGSGLIHLNANQLLYSRAVNILVGSELNRVLAGLYPYPVVLTLHMPWEKDPTIVKDLVEKIKGDLVPITAAKQWIIDNARR